MIVLKLIAPIIILLTSLMLLALQEKWKGLHDGRTKRHKRVMATLVVLMITGTVVTCVILWRDNMEASRLKDDIATLRLAEEERERQVDETGKIVALRATHAVAPFDLFLMPLAGKWGGPDLEWLCGQESFADCDEHNDEDTLDALRAAFRCCKMHEPTEMNPNLTMLDILYRQLQVVHSEAGPILQAYGGVSHPIVLQLEDFRSQARQLLRLLQTRSKIPGVEERWSDGVDEQWTAYFANLCLADIRLKKMCFQMLKMHGYRAAQLEDRNITR